MEQIVAAWRRVDLVLISCKRQKDVDKDSSKDNVEKSYCSFCLSMYYTVKRNQSFHESFRFFPLLSSNLNTFSSTSISSWPNWEGKVLASRASLLHPVFPHLSSPIRKNLSKRSSTRGSKKIREKAKVASKLTSGQRDSSRFCLRVATKWLATPIFQQSSNWI